MEQRNKGRLASMDLQVPWSSLSVMKAWVVIKYGHFPVVCRHLAHQGIGSLGLDDWARAHIFAVADLKKERLQGRILRRTAMGKQGVFVKYKPALHKALCVCCGVARRVALCCGSACCGVFGGSPVLVHAGDPRQAK